MGTSKVLKATAELVVRLLPGFIDDKFNDCIKPAYLHHQLETPISIDRYATFNMAYEALVSLKSNYGCMLVVVSEISPTKYYCVAISYRRILIEMRPILLVLLLVGLSSARWTRQGRARSDGATIVGQATSELSTAIFQGYIDDDQNIAFSPLGYSAILAMLAEGAKGETREQLVSALHLPSDHNLTRKTYKSILGMVPLKNFFYVYKNYTIHDSYKKILEDYYLTDVRSVERVQSSIHDDDDDDDDESKGEFTIEIPEKNSEDKVDDIPEMMPPKPSEEQLISFAVEDIPEKVDVSEIEYKPAKNIKEKIKLAKTYPKKESSGDDEETMVAVEARNHARSLKILQNKKDISSSLSVNSFGKKTSAKSVTDSLMLIFNGMYFRGSWKQPFSSVEPGVFYKSSTEKKSVPMMKAKGTYKTAYVAALDSEAVLLPYDNERFGLLVVVPRTRDGLTRLIADLPAAPLCDIQDMLKEEEIQLSLPVFYVETTTKPFAALAKFGVTKIFSRDADLSGVSADEGLFVQEMVQHVAVRVDNTDGSTSMITSSNAVAEATKNLPIQEKVGRRFSVEQPFIFFVIDQLDNLVVAAGKVNDPKQPTPFELKTREFF